MQRSPVISVITESNLNPQLFSQPIGTIEPVEFKPLRWKVHVHLQDGTHLTRDEVELHGSGDLMVIINAMIDAFYAAAERKQAVIAWLRTAVKWEAYPRTDDFQTKVTFDCTLGDFKFTIQGHMSQFAGMSNEDFAHFATFMVAEAAYERLSPLVDLLQKALK